MRPRPDAAENAEMRAYLATEHEWASMRPRPDAAENAAISRPCLMLSTAASMRPRPDAAENGRPATKGISVALTLQ